MWTLRGVDCAVDLNELTAERVFVWTGSGKPEGTAAATTTTKTWCENYCGISKERTYERTFGSSCADIEHRKNEVEK